MQPSPEGTVEWARVRDLFEQAVSLDRVARAQFLGSACPDESKLRAEVERLLEEHDRESRLLATPPLDPRPTFEPSTLVAGRFEGIRLLGAGGMAGQAISHYRILEKLGSGGMGVVYKAEDTNLDRTVALKFLAPHLLESEGHKQRFLREAKATASLDHPNICMVHEVGETDGQMFLAMGYIDGPEVRAKIKQRPLKLDEALDIAIQAAEGLRAAHQKGIVHRDIKSSNLMLTSTGRVKIVDFGLAQLTGGTRLTKTDTILGTPAYMSPEQAQRLATDRRTDIWSLGVVLYEMVTGRLPFEGEREQAVLYRIISEPHEPVTAIRAGVPLELDRLLSKALAKNPEQRYQHLDDMLVDLRAVQSGAAVKRGPRPRKLTRRAAMAAGAGGVVTLGTAGFYVFFGRRPIDSLAVLPFVNVGSDPDTEYLSDGISESLITSLSRLSGLRVLSRNTVFRYKGQGIDIRELGRELGVRAVLTGRLAQRGDVLSISAELVDTRDGAVIWGDQYNQPVAGILAIDRDIARQISQQLRLRLIGEQAQQVVGPSTRDAEAYRLYLQGRYLWNRRPAGLRQAAEYFQKAVDRDPGYALAWAGLADSFLMLGGWGLIPPPEAHPKARDAANRAIKMEETLAEPHATLGYFKTIYEWDWPGAEREFRRAIELNPEYGTAHHWYAYYLLTMGSASEAIAEIRRARDGDPLSPIINAEVAHFYIFARQCEQAVQEAQKALELDPAFPSTYRLLGHAYALQGKRREAKVAIEEAIRLAPPGTVFGAISGSVLAFAGYTEEARKLLGELTERDQTEYVFPALLGIFHASLGEHDQAFEYFEQALEERSMIASWLRDPILDDIASDPRFRSIFERMGLRP